MTINSVLHTDVVELVSSIFLIRIEKWVSFLSIARVSGSLIDLLMSFFSCNKIHENDVEQMDSKGECFEAAFSINLILS